MIGNSSESPPVSLAPPKDTPFTLEELAKYDGSDPSLPVYVAVKRTVFDVTNNPAYRGGYKVFCGKDASKALGMSSLEPEDCVPDYSGLDESQLKVLDNWHDFFKKRYNIVGKVVGV
ncbi:uncharacterized protein VTP21DRAFT_6697 [Calcarisporiella thermophila]|uniref:uncharacterized protein n=1 Tax=Calcarisporiella thermophila TaxID=911321 RepID=UPI003741EF72